MNTSEKNKLLNFLTSNKLLNPPTHANFFCYNAEAYIINLTLGLLEKDRTQMGEKIFPEP